MNLDEQYKSLDAVVSKKFGNKIGKVHNLQMNYKKRVETALDLVRESIKSQQRIIEFYYKYRQKQLAQLMYAQLKELNKKY